jgi:peroxiredoxin (alkyl hydroperoxide reductase subunit C)
MGCDIVTVSTDTQFSHLAWQRSEKELANVRYQMGADPTGKVSRLFGVYDESTGLDLRGTFIINPEGKLLNMEMNFYNLGRNIDEMMRKFKANIYMSKKTNEVCPSKWKDEGDKKARWENCVSVLTVTMSQPIRSNRSCCSARAANSVAQTNVKSAG